VADITFGPFALDVAGARLVRQGTEVRLRRQALNVLKVLAMRPGRPVDHAQMIAEAWGNGGVTKHTVDVTVADLRRALGEYGSWITHRPKLGYCLEIPKADELIKRGWHFWNRRTREGFERARECFHQAASDSTTDFRAFEGLASSYLMLATYGMRPPRDMYAGFLEAHGRAVELVGLTPELRCNLAHGLHMFERRLTDAEREFAETERQQPSLGPLYLRRAMLDATLGRLDDALAQVTRAHGIDPLMPTLPATQVAVRFWRREFEDAVAVGKQSVELHPYLQLGRAFYAQALEYSGRIDEALAQYQIGSILSADLPWLRALEGTCLVKKGRLAEAKPILQGLEQLRQSEYVDAYFMAVFRHALGQRDEALRELERACDENSAWLYAIDVDPKMDVFRDEPRYARVRERLHHEATKNTKHTN
jgi:DNA-binding winged helix-turn-helix (wHTH) protein/predicted Zn-dependent protease